MLLQAVELRFGYARRPRASARGLVIDDVSLEIDHGALVGILGPNGSGKTTLLRLLAGTLRPDSGFVRLNGEDLRRISRAALARRFAVVPQETQLAFEYTALEIALMGRYPHLGAFEIEGPADVACALAALEATGTQDLADRPFQTLSGGEKQRVIIASALAQLDTASQSSTLLKASGAPPPLARAQAFEDSLSSRGALPQDASPKPDGHLLLLDEPTASLDLRYQIEVAELIRRLHDQQRIAIVLSTHDLHFAAAVCTDVVLLREGQVLARGRTADVLTPERLAVLYDVDPDRLRHLRDHPLTISAS